MQTGSIQRLELFPTLVLATHPDISTDIGYEMSDFVKQRCFCDTKRNLIQTQSNLHEIQLFRSLCEAILDVSDMYMKSSGYEWEHIEVTSMWGNLMRHGGNHPPHVHPNSLLSGVYYPNQDFDESLKGIVFLDPRMQSLQIQPTIRTPNRFNQKRVDMPCRPNVLYVFPSWLQHYVDNSYNGERISISFNLMIKGKVGNLRNLTQAEF